MTGCNSDPVCAWVPGDSSASPPTDDQCLCADGYATIKNDSTDCLPCEGNEYKTGPGNG